VGFAWYGREESSALAEYQGKPGLLILRMRLMLDA
jgi:hypothetical protein